MRLIPKTNPISTIAALAYWEAWRWRVKGQDDPLLSWLQKALENGSQISISLANRKYYVGVVVMGPALRDNTFIRLLVTRSGYRDEKTLVFHQTNNYEQRISEVSKLLKQKNMSSTEAEIILPYVLLPLADIKTANYFYENTYIQFAKID